MKRKILVFAPLMALLLSGCFARIPLDPSGSTKTSASQTPSSSQEPGPSEDTYGTLDNPITVAKAVEIGEALDGISSKDVFADKDAFVKGVVFYSDVEEGKYNLAVSDSAASQKILYFYAGSLASGVAVPVEGDEVVLFGRIDNYDKGMILLKGSEEEQIANPVVKKSTHVEYTITLTKTGEGTITGVENGKKVKSGEKVEFTVAPASGYKLEYVKINGETATPTEGKYSFTVAGATSIEVKFAQDIHVEKVELNKEELLLTKGESEKLVATVTPTEAEDKSVTWTVENVSPAGCVTVDSDGTVHGIAAGTATVQVKTNDGGKTDTCAVTVNPKHVSGVTLNKEELLLEVGEQETLVADVKPTDADDKTVTWSIVENSDVPTGCVTVDSDGTVHGIAAGTATVQVKTNDGGKTATCVVTVEEEVHHVESVEITNKPSDPLIIGGNVTLNAKVSPTEADDKTVIWTVENASPAGCVTVNQSTGYVEAVKVGSATVVVTTQDKGKTDSVVITVNPKLVESVSIQDAPEKALKVDDKVQLSVIVLPNDATLKEVDWSSTDSSIVSVDANGEITAKGVGSATITAAAKDTSGKSDSVTITVEATKVEFITLNKGSTSLEVGSTETLSVTSVLPDNATDKSYTWSSSDTSVATVSETGLVTAKAEGIATIKATANDGSGVHGDCIVTVTEPSSDTYGTLDNPITVAEARTIAQALNNTTAKSTVFETKDAYVRGVITSEVKPSTQTVGTYQFYMGDTSSTSNNISFYWGTIASGVTVPIQGETVVAFGRLGDFLNEAGTNHTYELAGRKSDITDPVVMKVEPVTPTSVDISSTPATVAVGSEITLKGKIGPTGARGELTWTIDSGTAYATLSGDKLTGVAAGSVTVRAAVVGHTSVTATKTITVTSEATTVDATMGLGKDAGNAISSTPATVKDNQNNSWTVISEFAGNEKFNTDTDCAHIGSSTNKVNKVTMTLDFGASKEVSAFKIKLKGNSTEDGAISVKVGTTSIFSGKINSNTITEFEATSSGTGTSIVVEITPTKKGSVYIYELSYTYSK